MNNSSESLFKLIKNRLPPEAWRYIDARISAVRYVEGVVERIKDGKLYRFRYDMLGGELSLERYE